MLPGWFAWLAAAASIVSVVLAIWAVLSKLKARDLAALLCLADRLTDLRDETGCLARKLAVGDLDVAQYIADRLRARMIGAMERHGAVLGGVDRDDLRDGAFYARRIVESIDRLREPGEPSEAVLADLLQKQGLCSDHLARTFARVRRRLAVVSQGSEV